MKILLLYDKLNVGGTEKLLILIANLLHQHGNNVILVLTQSPEILDQFINTKIEVVYLNRKNKFALNPLRKLAKLCKAADVVHIHTYFNYRYYFLAKTLFGKGSSKVVLQEHSNMFYIKWWDKLILKKLDAFIAVSTKQVSLLIGWNILMEQKIFLLSNISSVPNKVVEKAEPVFRLIMVGNIRREKNYELAINVVEHFKGKLSLDIYGNINDHSYYNQLINKLQTRGLSADVKFICGEPNVSAFFNNYDLALHTAKHETGPLVLMEYLSAGLPFFSTNAGQAPAVIAEHIPGVVCSTFDESDWIRKIEEFYSQSQHYRTALSAELKTKAAIIINEEIYYRNLMNVYDYMLRN